MNAITKQARVQVKVSVPQGAVWKVGTVHATRPIGHGLHRYDVRLDDGGFIWNAHDLSVRKVPA